MEIDWSPLTQELAIWRQQKLDLPLWWRDDDAVSHTEALDRLAKMSEQLGCPVHIAAIPKFADRSLAAFCKTAPQFIPLVHGWSHTDHSLAGEKKSEFGRSRPLLLEEAQQGLGKLTKLFGADLAPVFVPPWNRVTSELIPELPKLGYQALSTYTPREKAEPAPGLFRINTHIDPINWRKEKELVPPEQLLIHIIKLLRDRRMEKTDPTEPLGLLTHHLVHSQEVWRFSHELLAVLLDAGARPVSLKNTLKKQ